MEHLKEDADFLKFCNADWNISGLFTHDQTLLFYIDLLKECGIDIKMTVHGSIPCRWNSGRIIKSVSEQYQETVLEEYAKRGTGVLLTFSNYMMDQNDLDDTLSNRILDMVAQYPGNGVIAGSALLSDYVHKKYNDLFLSTSILRVVHEHGKGNVDYYNDLAMKYDRVVLHPDDGFNLELLEGLKEKEKFEILVNENCVRNCPVREEHCDIVSRYYASKRDDRYMDALTDFKKNKCKSVQSIDALSSFIHGERKTCNMTTQELENLYTMGFFHFKIQGRSLSAASLIYDITRYMLSDNISSTVCKMILDRIDVYNGTEDVLNTGYKYWERI